MSGGDDNKMNAGGGTANDEPSSLSVQYQHHGGIRFGKSHMCIVGSSLAGKTRLALQIVADLSIFTFGIAKIVYLYEKLTPHIDEFRRLADQQNVSFEALRYAQVDFDAFNVLHAAPLADGHTLLIADDCTTVLEECRKFCSFVQTARHIGVHIMALVHQTTYRSVAARAFLANVGYFIFMCSPRGREICLRWSSQFGLRALAAYAYDNEQRSAPYSNLLFDLTPEAQFPIYGNLFPNETRKYTSVYAPRA